MKYEQILKKAIEKAVKNGLGSFNSKHVEIVTRYKKGIWGLSINDEDGVYGMDFRSDSDLIFSHDFAKAFWGEEELDYFDMALKMNEGRWRAIHQDGTAHLFFAGTTWQYHLQQMVLEEDPIKYLEKFI